MFYAWSEVPSTRLVLNWQEAGRKLLKVVPLLRVNELQGEREKICPALQVHFATTKEALAAHFGEAGTVTDVRILLDPATRRSRGSVVSFPFSCLC